jgi:chemotaxis protein histidine kinase CheA
MNLPAEYFKIYFEESAVRLSFLEQLFHREPDPEVSPDHLKRARIAAHSLKGDSLTMKFDEIGQTAAELENLLRQAEEFPQDLNWKTCRQLVDSLSREIRSRRSSHENSTDTDPDLE